MDDLAQLFSDFQQKIEIAVSLKEMCEIHLSVIPKVAIPLTTSSV